MAWVTKENLESKKPVIKAILKEYGLKGSLSGTNSYTMKLTITSGKIDFIGNYLETVKVMHDYEKNHLNGVAENQCVDINPYWYQEHFSGMPLEALQKLVGAMKEGNHDRSDIQSDYFDVGWYIGISIGKYNKPYELI